MNDDPEDLPERLRDAQRASTNSAVVTVITILFGVVWLADRDSIPTWIVSGWFIVVIPLNLYLLAMNRRRYRNLKDQHDGERGGRRD